MFTHNGTGKHRRQLNSSHQRMMIKEGQQSAMSIGIRIKRSKRTFTLPVCNRRLKH